MNPDAYDNGFLSSLKIEPASFELDPSIRITPDADLSTRPPQWLLDMRAAQPWWRRLFR